MKKKTQSPRSSPIVTPLVELYQSVWITFNDGTRAGYIGQAKAFPGDARKIQNIEFTEPKTMPPNYHFKAIE